MSLKAEFRSLIVKYLVKLFSELIALMKFSVLEIAGFASKFDLFSNDCSLINLLSFKTEYGRNILVQSIQYQ